MLSRLKRWLGIPTDDNLYPFMLQSTHGHRIGEPGCGDDSVRGFGYEYPASIVAPQVLSSAFPDENSIELVSASWVIDYDAAEYPTPVLVMVWKGPYGYRRQHMLISGFAIYDGPTIIPRRKHR